MIPPSANLQGLTRIADRPAYVDDDSGRHILSVVSVTDDLYLLSIWLLNATGFWLSNAFTPYLLPLLTWIAALVAAAFASSRLVVRHVRALSRTMGSYVSTKQRLQIPDLSGAPAEIQSLHAAYEGLIRTIEQEEADLQNLLCRQGCADPRGQPPQRQQLADHRLDHADVPTRDDRPRAARSA